jgi:hypothetical protein
VRPEGLDKFKNSPHRAPKVMPLIYFHGNYNRQKAYDNAVGYIKFSATKLPPMAMPFR